MRVHKLNNVEQAMDLLEKHKVYLTLFLCHFSCYVELNEVFISLGLRCERSEWRGKEKGRRLFCS